MEKIRQLMEKCGLSSEAATSICEAFNGHLLEKEKELEAEYERRTEMAKKICVEETEAAKLELARRTQIYCEAKSAAIENIIAKQAQAREGQAASTLEQVKGLLEGVSIADDDGLRHEVKALKESVARLTSERNQAITKAQRQTEIAEKVMTRNRLLESKIAIAEDQGRKATKPTQIGENRGRQVNRLDVTRKNAAPRQAINEAVDRRPQRQRLDQSRSMTPAEIAMTIPDGPV